MSEKKTLEKKSLGGWAFLPLLVFLALYIGTGVILSIMGAEKTFGAFPRHVALLVGFAVAMLMQPGESIQQKTDLFCKHMGNEGVMQVILIYLLASGFQGAAATMGGKESVVNLALHFIPTKLLIPGVFLMCCLISTAIGTSMGTIAAMGPVALSVAQGAGLSTAITAAAVIGGSYFGDNLSMISDTTISAAKGCGSEMRDKFKMNFWIALPAALIAMALYTVFGGTGSGAVESGAFNVLKVLPYLLVLVTALAGMNVTSVLLLGIASTGVIGFATGSCGFLEWIQGIGEGMADMFSISIAAALISGTVGLAREYGGIEWFVEKIRAKIRNRRSAEYGLGLLSGVLSAALVNNTLAIIVSCPIANELGEEYHIAPKRLASLVDIFACGFMMLIPHDGGIMMLTAMSGDSPFTVLKYSFYPIALLIATCVTIQLGLLRTPEEKAFENAQKAASSV
ncbi:MAG: Na+/H+ antiporter NhaC family protein [Oscillospiraceae bacterium]|nr:Na+/H+ antiporter NhaC family protein [Oscillospiraceae bacterium]